MKYGSVCSGIEAATQAWHHMGWKPSFFSEIDAFPCAVLQHHYPKIPLHGDFTTIQDGDYEPINLLVGGTPCQSFSVAGLRKGLDDPRGNLMLGFGALAKRLRPAWLVWENVPGVLSANGGRDFGTFLGMLAEPGYGFAYRVLDAQFFGVAQRRKRVFVVGYLGDWRPAAAVLFERESLSGNPAPSREAKEDVAGTFKACASSGGWSNSVDHAAAGYMQPVNTYQNVSHCLNAGGMGRIDYETESFVVHGTQDPRTGSQAFALGRNNGAENAVFVSLRGREGGATAELGGPIAGTLRASSGGGDKPHIMCFAQNTRDEVREMPYAGAIAANPGMKQTSYARIGMAVRRLTPVECERLQGFPEQEKSIDLIVQNGAIIECIDHPRNYANAAIKCRKLQGSADLVGESGFPSSVKSAVKDLCVGQASRKKHAVVNVEINYVAGTLQIHRYPNELMFSAKIAEPSKSDPRAIQIEDFAQLSAELISCVGQILRDGKAGSQSGTCNSTKPKNGVRQKKKQESGLMGCVKDATSERCPASEVITLTTSQDTSTIKTSDLSLRTLLSCASHAIDGFTPSAIQKTNFCTIRLTVTDAFTKIPYRGKSEDKCPDGPRYKALGNSMAVPCMKWIGERIQQVQEIAEKDAKEAAA